MWARRVLVTPGGPLLHLSIYRKIEINFYYMLKFISMMFIFRSMSVIRLNLSKIEELMDKFNLSQAQLARKSGWTPRNFNRIWKETEKGEMPGFNITGLNGLCNALSCRPMTILDYKPDPDEPDPIE